MATETKRNYRLVGADEETVALDNDHIEDRVETSWWHPALPRKELKVLMQRRDGPFNVTSGAAIHAPARKALRTYRAEQRGDKVFINIPEGDALQEAGTSG